MTHQDWIVMTCPTCGAKMAPSLLEPERYQCQYCGNEYLLKNLLGKPESTVGKIRPRLAPPESVKIERETDRIRMIHRWFSFKYIPLAFFALAWDVFLVFWYGMAFTTGAPWIMICFPVAHVAVGVGLTYSVLTGFFNRTIVELTRDELAVWFEPLPWLGEKILPVAEISQFYCKKKVSQNSKGTSVNYALHAVMRDGKDVKLLENFDSPEIAQFLEQQLETWLKIPDRPVAGEFRGE